MEGGEEGAGYTTGSQSSEVTEQGLREAYFNTSSEEEELSSGSSQCETENQRLQQSLEDEAEETLEVTLHQLETARREELARDFEDTHQPLKVVWGGDALWGRQVRLQADTLS